MKIIYAYIWRWINKSKLIKIKVFSFKNKKTATMTVVRPPVRFGEVKLKKKLITNFKEKPQIKNSWINGGFFVFNKKIFKYLNKKKKRDA